MPNNADFKKLVRERMAKTGESYTAARRQLVADRPVEVTVDQGWRFGLTGIFLPKRMSPEEWEAASAARDFGKSPDKVDPTAGLRPRRPPPILETTLVERLRGEVDRAGINRVEDAWQFLRSTGEDTSELRKAKDRFRREAGVAEVWRVVPTPLAALNYFEFDHEGRFTRHLRAARCNECAARIGDVDIAPAWLEGGAAEVEAEVLALHRHHAEATPTCRRAAAVITQEWGR
jgi:hypothetical protein